MIYLLRSGYETTVYPTQYPNDGYNKILSCGSLYDRIVVAGGDGTLHESFNAVKKLPNKVEIGYIPTGTVNDFAKTYNIKNNVLKAAEDAACDNIRNIDLGQFNENYFSYIAAFGIGTQVSYETDQNLKNKMGNMAYYIEILKYVNFETFKKSSKELTLRINDREIINSFIFGAITNTKSVGGFKNFVNQDIKLDDGLFEGLFVKTPKNLIEFEQIKNGILKKDYSSNNFIYISNNHFEIESAEPIAWTLDGENGGKWNNAVVNNLNNEIRLVVP